MNQTQSLPGRIDAKEAARILGFQKHDIPMLMREKLLKPLGSPAPNSPKWFSSMEIIQKAGDTEWLNQATKSISKMWRVKNKQKRISKPQREIYQDNRGIK